MVRTRSNSSFEGFSFLKSRKTWISPKGRTMARYSRSSSIILLARFSPPVGEPIPTFRASKDQFWAHAVLVASAHPSKKHSEMRRITNVALLSWPILQEGDGDAAPDPFVTKYEAPRPFDKPRTEQSAHLHAVLRISVRTQELQ